MTKLSFRFLLIIAGLWFVISQVQPSHSLSQTDSPELGQDPPTQAGFPVTLNSDIVRFSSVSLGDITNNGNLDVVVGTSDGEVHVYRGNGSKVWEYDTGNAAIEGKPAIADIDNDGRNEIVVGAGSTFSPNAHGGVYVLEHNGALKCDFDTGDFNNNGWRDGVFSSPALGRY